MNSSRLMTSPLGRVISSRVFLIVVLVLAAGLRVAHVLSLRDLPLFNRLILDSEYYDKWAQYIASGHWMGGDRAFFFDPLYSYVLAVFYYFIGRDLLIVRLFQVLLGVATCGLVAVIGRRVGGKIAGNLAALLFAIYKPAIFQEGEIEKTALGIFLISLALIFFTSKSLKARLAAGTCLGLAALTRGNMLLLAPLGALYFLFESGSLNAAEPETYNKVRWRERFLGRPGQSALVFLIGLFIVLIPVAWRNHMVSGEWILTTSGAGTNFYTGNNPNNNTGGFEYVPFVRPQSGYEENDFRVEAEKRIGHTLSPKEVSSYWFVEALKHIAANPKLAAIVTLKKFILFWSNYESPDAWDMYFLKRYSTVMSLPLLSMGWLLPFAALGAYFGFRDSREIRLLVGYIIVYMLSVVAFYVFARYRLHIVPALVVLAALALLRISDLNFTQNMSRGLAYMCAASLIAVFSFMGMRSFGLTEDDTQSFISLSYLYIEKSDFLNAEILLKEALLKQHGAGQAAPLCALGELNMRVGNLTQAVDLYNRCVQANPRQPNAFMQLGMAYEVSGMINKALEAYESQIRIVPGHVDALQGLSRLRSMQKPP